MSTTTNFATLAAEWLEKKRDSVKPSTLTRYELTIKRRLLPALGNAAGLTEAEVQRMVDEGRAAGVSRRTLRDAVAVTKQIAVYAHKAHGLPAPEAWEIKLPRGGAGRRLPLLTTADHRRLLDHLAAEPTPGNIGALLALSTGMRIGETAGLRWADVDLRQQTITISRTVSRIYDPATRRTAIVEGPPKTGNSERTVPMSAELRAALRMVREAEGPAAVYVAGGGRSPVDPRSIRDRFRRLLRRLEIPAIVFHGLRHTFATRCIECGCDVKTVSAILGHSNVATTMNLYVHPTGEQKQRCLERLSTFINSKRNNHAKGTETMREGNRRPASGRKGSRGHRTTGSDAARGR